ncbi:hypothetical protein EXS71_02185 [Candidatus Uhrbacteria bacterium]|nr:hypothetical protein [Candidatus Uhrbacteria bacterium]
MAQLGRCECGTPLQKVLVKSRSSTESVPIDLCPVCDLEKFPTMLQKSNPDSTSVAVKLDRFGLEKMEK